MKDIFTILSGLEIAIPEDKKEGLRKAVSENYKTVADYQKKVDALEKAEAEANTAREAIAKFEGIVTAAGGTVVSTEKWGARKLAYAINYQTEGYYVLMTFECDPSIIAEITRVAGITEGMLRQMVTKVA